MTTSTQTTPEATIINRLGSIPLVASSLSAAHSTLQSNRLTSGPYTTAAAVSAYAFGTANKYSAPLQTRLAPLVARADDIANAAVDAVEARYPYPFQARPEDVYTDLTNRTEEVKDVAHKAIDHRVYAPAGRVVAGIDQRFTPLVDVYEACLNKIAPSTSSPQSSSLPQDAAPTSYQYQRALTLTLSLRDSLYASSSQQIQQLQQQSVLIQRANQTARSLGDAAHNNATTMQTRASQLGETMVADLQSVRQATSHLPAHIQDGLAVLNRELSGTIHDLSVIVGDQDLPVGDKVARVRITVQERVQPLLDATTAKIYEYLGVLKGTKDAAKEKAAEVSESSDVQESRAAFADAAERVGIKVRAPAEDAQEQEIEVAAAAREHTEEAQAAGFSFADAAKGVVAEELNGDA